MKTALRKINVDGNLFLWNRKHIHGENHGTAGCTEKVTVYLEGFKRAPLYLFFNAADNQLILDDPEKERWCIGYPEDGVIWLNTVNPLTPGEACKEFNLNRPAVIETLIRHYLQNGWDPRTIVKPFVDNQALKLVAIISFPKEKEQL